MLPIFMSQKSDQKPNSRAVLLGALVGITLMIGFALFTFNPALMTRTIIPIVFGVLVVVLPILYVFARGQNEKRKRSGQDMYSVIDRMVEDLDEDEIAYLRRRLEDRERQRDSALADDVVELLNQRDLDRRAGKRE
jgi:cadmium resistance protein CadD (predicted permease)